LNDSLTYWITITCWAQERGFRLYNPVILQPRTPGLNFRAPERRSGAFRLTLTLVTSCIA